MQAGQSLFTVGCWPHGWLGLLAVLRGSTVTGFTYLLFPSTALSHYVLIVQRSENLLLYHMFIFAVIQT